MLVKTLIDNLIWKLNVTKILNDLGNVVTVVASKNCFLVLQLFAFMSHLKREQKLSQKCLTVKANDKKSEA